MEEQIPRPNLQGVTMYVEGLPVHLGRRLGSGGYGAAYWAYAPELTRQEVAVKAWHIPVESRPEYACRNESEEQAILLREYRLA